MKKIFKNLGFVLLGVALTVPAIVTPLMLANKTSKDQYDDTIIMPPELYLNAKGQGVLASTITKQNAIEYISGIPTNDSYNIVEIQDVRLPSDKPDGGSVFITLKLSRKSNPNLYKTQTYLVNGFMYESENKFKNTKLAPTELAKTILPSDLSYPQISKTEIEKYVKNIPNFSNEKAEVSIEYKIANDEKGTLTLSLLYKKDSRIAKIQETVSGFKSLGEVWKEQIDKEFTKFKFKAKPNAISILPSNVKNNEILMCYITGFEGVTLENDVKEEISNIQPNNDDGSLSFDLTLSKGSVRKTQTYNVPGFKTKAMQDEEDVNNIYESLLKYQARTTSAAGLRYPDVVNADNISTYIINLPKKPTNGVKIEYTNFISNNQNGELGFDIKISKGNIEKTIPQRSIFGFFSDNTVAYVLEEFKKTINKKSTDDFVHRTDPNRVNNTNFKNYFIYNTTNRYGINLNFENIEFIPIQASAYFRISFRATHSSGLNRTISIDWQLGSLYANNIVFNLLEIYGNPWTPVGPSRGDSSAWKAYNFFSLVQQWKPVGSISWESSNLANPLIVNGTTTSAIGPIPLNLYIRYGNDENFAKNLASVNKIFSITEIVKSLSNQKWLEYPSDIENPIGTNIYYSNFSSKYDYLGLRFKTITYDNWLHFPLEHATSGNNRAYVNVSLDTNGKYNFTYSKREFNYKRA